MIEKTIKTREGEKVDSRERGREGGSEVSRKKYSRAWKELRILFAGHLSWCREGQMHKLPPAYKIISINSFAKTMSSVFAFP